ncbi:MAG: ACP S-malonyltransferase, partial [Ruminococcus sp.]|nr:ACP S-malonyltransferase [Ruminococcus sp.]
MTIALFSGQGSQQVGMGKDFAEIPEVKSIIETGSEILGRDIMSILTEIPQEELNLTINAQPAIMTVSLMALRSAEMKGFTFDGVAGHSLGEYAGMQASGMITLEDAFRLIKARSEAMDEASPNNKGTMAAVM